MKNKTTINTLIQPIFVISLAIGLFLPISAINAQSDSPRFERNARTGALYLMPTLSFSEYDSSSGGRPGTAGGLSVSCAPSTLRSGVGQTITWFSSVSGGQGTYLYSWGGTEGLSGNTSAVSKAYPTSGEKSAILTVTSGTRQVTVSCGSMLVGGSATNSFTYQAGGFGASCYATPERAAPGESVTWVAILSGITASTSYTWDGTDGLTGDGLLVT